MMFYYVHSVSTQSILFGGFRCVSFCEVMVIKSDLWTSFAARVGLSSRASLSLNTANPCKGMCIIYNYIYICLVRLNLLLGMNYITTCSILQPDSAVACVWYANGNGPRDNLQVQAVFVQHIVQSQFLPPLGWLGSSCSNR